MVSGFDSSQPPQKAKVVDATVRYTCRDTGDHLILMSEVEHSLLCPMQCRMNGLVIYEVPKFLTTNLTASTHSILIADPTNDVHPYTIPLQLEGIVSYFEYSLPTSAEFEDNDILHLEIRAVPPAWDPYDKDFASLEESHLDFRKH